MCPFRASHAEVGADSLKRFLSVIEVGALRRNVLVESAHLLLVGLSGQFLLKLFGLLLLFFLKLSYHGSGALQPTARRTQALRRRVQLLLQGTELLRIHILDGAQAAGELVLELRRQLLADLSLLRLQRLTGRVGFVDGVYFTHDQRHEHREDQHKLAT